MYCLLCFVCIPLYLYLCTFGILRTITMGQFFSHHSATSMANNANGRENVGIYDNMSRSDSTEVPKPTITELVPIILHTSVQHRIN